ncbi:MAG: response regulator, partial [Spirochaetales bacterium]|nr:response regulator [Spirochaetales bacterium]
MYYLRGHETILAALSFCVTMRSMTEYLFRSERQRDDSPSSILVVDDEEVICRMLGALLEKKGYRVRTASDFSTALGYLGTEQFDLVITDLYFPGGDGIDIIRRVKTDDPDIPVIALTGSPEQQAIIDVFRNQADDILIKPVGKDELYFRVSGTLEKRFLRLREKEMKRELETREQLFRSFMDHLPLHIFIND